MDLNDIRALAQVADQGSFQGAARAFRVSRTTLRRQIENLEALVGTSLLHRDPQGVTPTEAGRVLLEQTGPLLKQAGEAVRQARDAGQEPRGRVRVAGPIGIPTALRAQGMAALHRAYPELIVHLYETADPVGEVASFDLALHFGSPPDRDGWISKVMRRTPLRLRASTAYAAEHGLPATVEELSQHPLISWRHPELDPRSWPLANGERVDVEPWFVSASPVLVRELAVAGVGLALFPDGELDPVEDAGLVTVLPEVVGRPEALRVLAARPARSDPRIRGLMQNISALIDGLPSE